MKIVSKVLIIGAGAAGNVVTQKCARETATFSEVHLASRTISKCEAIQKKCDSPIQIHALDADNTQEVIDLIKKVNPKLIINMALPYQDLSIMDACLDQGIHYMDTANYEPKDEAKFSYTWQWAYQDRFKNKNIMGLLGSGFDPGVTNVFIAYAKKHFFDVISEVDIIDCNDGDHGHPFATNFNPEINIREITQPGRYFKDGQWIQTGPLEVSETFDFPEVGPRKAYLLFHEEMESLTKHFPEVKQMRFWMTFSESYITHLRVLENVGLTNIHPIKHQGMDIVPLEFLKSVLPVPSELGQNYKGKTSIGCVIKGTQNGKEKTIIIYNICNHQDAFKDVGAQAVSYTTGVPAVVGAKLILDGVWSGSGVFNMEQMDPDPFMDLLPKFGLSWSVKEL